MDTRHRTESPSANQLAAFQVNTGHQRRWFHRDGASSERFRLDAVDQCLWKHVPDAADRRIPLTPKAFAVLTYLVDNAGRLIAHEEFLEAVWPGVYIQPEGLKSQILTLRSALEDDARNPRFIEALPRRGYRFIARIATDASADGTGAPAPSPSLVGRERPLSELRAILQRSIDQRQREIVFVTGESGIGKTSVVDEFIRQTRQMMPQAMLARGQCVEGYGGGKEGYYPMLEALGELCRGERGTQVLRALASCAPTWLAQFPALAQTAHLPAVQRELPGAGHERMLRELRDVCEQLASDAPVVLVFEDLQWIDPSTVDFIDVLARTRAPMRLLLIGTYRPADLAPREHPLRTLGPRLQVHRLCSELPLDPLTEDHIAAYLAAQTPAGASVPDGLAGLIHHRTEGNPLFMVTLLEHLCQRGLLAKDGGAWKLQAPLHTIDFELPETLRGMIDACIERLSAEEQSALELASIAGGEFDPRSCADAAGVDPERMEELCRALGDRHFILRRSTGNPTGSTCNAETRYRFVHAMYREVLYGRQAPARRARLQLKFETRITSLPNRLPSSRPMNACGAFSRPLTMSSRNLTLPSSNHALI